MRWGVVAAIESTRHDFLRQPATTDRHDDGAAQNVSVREEERATRSINSHQTQPLRALAERINSLCTYHIHLPRGRGFFDTISAVAFAAAPACSS